ncbi:MAG: phage capsid protein [Kiloniellales bacterium]|nr:phage capsid protein [Kiloniellales bacterium]
MSTSIDLSFVKQFEREVHEAYQRRGSLLRGTVRTKNNVRGASTTFQKVGKGAATTKARHGQITPMNASHDPIECQLADFYAGDWVDKLDELKTNHDEREVVANAGAWGLGRKTDELVLTAAGATTSFVGDFTGAMTRTLFLESVEALNGADVPNDGGRFGLLSPRQWSVAMTINEFASADFVGKDLPFVKAAGSRTWLGVNWIMHTGLTGVGSNQTRCLLYHRTAIGHAVGADVMTDITWHGDRAAHFVNNMMSQGACLIDPEGVVEIRVNDTLAIPA